MSKERSAQILAQHKSGKKIYAGSTLNQAAQKLGSKGGTVGGPARAEALSQDERSMIAAHAARKRWGVGCGCIYCIIEGLV